jgi:hypothetical protein
VTRQEAAEKVAKLVRLSRDNPNPHEASAARDRARKIVAEHDLTVEELSAGKKAAAFDDLLAALRKSLASSPGLLPGLFDTSGVVSGVLAKLETLSKESKSQRLDEAYKVVEAAALLNGGLGILGIGTTAISRVKKIFEDALAAHDLTPPR